MMNDYGITMTNSFVKRIKRVIESEDNGNSIYGLRAGLVGGGCSGMQYTFSFAHKADDGDVVIEDDDLRVVIDPISIEYMRDSVFDYRTSVGQEQIVIKSPHLTKSCGCGMSVGV